MNTVNIRITEESHTLLIGDVVTEIKKSRPALQNIKLSHPEIIAILIEHYLACEGI